MKNKELSSEQSIKIELKKLDRYAWYIGVVGMIFLFGFTIFATQFHIWFDFTNTGQIGDTIGGVTAPIIGVFSALLIYLSFRAQIKANLIVQGQINDQKKQIEQQKEEDDEKKEREIQMTLYNQIKDAVLHFKVEENSGIEAIHIYFSALLNEFVFDISKRHFVFANIFLLIEELLKRIECSNKKGMDSYLSYVLIEFLYNQILSEKAYILFKYETKEQLEQDFPKFKVRKIDALYPFSQKLRLIDLKIEALRVYYTA